MCGIVGCIERQRPVESHFIKGMLSEIVHRGPDDEGIYCSEKVGLGMRRLSIIDVSGGHQPMFNEDSSIAVVFNGEIYNYKELSGRLRGKGHAFSSRADTEVIVHGYEEKGTSCVDELNGMFALAVWDDRKKRFFAARDRLGIKPLYYSFSDTRFLFASEIKALVRAIDREIDTKALSDYLTFRYVPETETIWKNVKKLAPAHWLELDTEGWRLSTHRYWEIPYKVDSGDGQCVNEGDWLRDFALLFEDSVTRHLQSDVPVGILLSGGLDSSAVLAAVNRLHTKSVYSFSVGFEGGEEFNELKYAREMAKSVGATNREVVIGHKEFVDFLPDFVWYTDEPLADLASIPLYYVAKLAASEVKVVLSGEGSDEILGGYDLEFLFREYEKSRRYRFLPLSVRRRLLKPIFDLKVDYYDLPSTSLFHMTNLFSPEQKRALMGADTQDSMNVVRDYYAKVQKVHPLNQMLYVLSQSWLVEDLLMKADKMTMANSIELRVPFLDYRLVEWAARAPVSMKIGYLNGKLTTKKVLRMYCHGKVPQVVIERPKKGFPVPAYDWLSSELREFASDTLDRQSRVSDIFDKEAVGETLSKGVRADAPILDRHRLWSLLILEFWLKRWLGHS